MSIVPSWMRTSFAVLVGILIVVGLGVLYFNQGMDQILALAVPDLDFSALPDGIYQGGFSHGRWLYQVEVQVRAGVVEDIEIIKCAHEPLIRSLNRRIIEEILQNQSLDIQGVSGATVNTRALQKAIEDAVKRQPQG